MDQQVQLTSPLSCLVNNEAALKAAERLSQQVQDGLRFCCESGRKLTVAEGRKRDEADAARRARFQQSMAALEERLLAAEEHDTEVTSSSNQLIDEDDVNEFAEFEAADDADFPSTFALDDDADVDAEELLELEMA